METFGEILANARKQARLAQKELASRVGLSANHLNRIEKNDRRPPRRAKVLAIAEVLELDTEGANRLLIAAGYAPVEAQGERHGFSFGSPIDLEQLRDLLAREKDIDVSSPAIGKLVDLLNDPGIPSKYKATIERLAISFIEWLRHSAEKETL